jgi:hypothetical protein
VLRERCSGAIAADEFGVLDARVEVGELGRAEEAGDIVGDKEIASHCKQDACEGRMGTPRTLCAFEPALLQPTALGNG